MEARLQRLTAYGALLMIVLVFIGFAAIAGVLPPPSPSASAQQILDRYTHDSLRIRLGLAVLMYSSVLTIPFVVAIGSQISRIEGKWGLLSLTQVLAGFIAMPIPLTFGPTIIMSATFRPSARSAETMLAFSDFFWLAWLGPGATAAIEVTVIAVAILSDRSTPRVFPRWVGYFNIWCALLDLSTVAMFFFQDGPLAWNGLIAFWLPTIAFGIWVLVMIWALLQSARQSLNNASEPALAAGRAA